VATIDSGTVAEVSMLETETSSINSAEEMLREDMLAGRQEKETAILYTRESFAFLVQIFVDKTRLAFMYEIGIHILYICIRQYYFYMKNKSA
jgi:hypothetical protein